MVRILCLILLLSFGCSYSYKVRVNKPIYREFTKNKLAKDVVGKNLIFRKSIWVFNEEDDLRLVVLEIKSSKESVVVEASLESQKIDDLLVGRVYFHYHKHPEGYNLSFVENIDADIRKVYD